MKRVKMLLVSLCGSVLLSGLFFSNWPKWLTYTHSSVLDIFWWLR
jgi:hypothetical protein